MIHLNLPFQLSEPVTEQRKEKINLATGELKVNTTQLNKSMNRFMVTKISIQADHNNILLVINLTRHNTSFWLSLFIPSICLVFVAEITLFINEKHFKATITVALTASLVLYTMYTNIQEELPDDSRLKLIDIWLLHGFLMPMVVFIVLASNEFLDFDNKTSWDSKIKVANSAVKDKDVVDDKDSKWNKRKTCVLLCKFAVPITSIVFIISFFIVMSMNFTLE